MELGRAKLDVVVDASGARSGANEVKSAFDRIKEAGENTLKGIDSAFDRLKDKIFSLKSLILGFGIYELGKSFIDAGRETENYTIRLQVLLGSVEKGKKLFADMNDYAARTPFAFKDVMASVTNLAGVVKGGADEIKAMMPMIADLAAASGLGIQETTQQVIKMFSAGAGAADQFRERGVLAMMGFKAGVQYNVDETRKMMLEAWEKPASKFRDASKLLVDTWEGAVSNLEDAWFQFQQRVMVDGGLLKYMRSIVQVLTDEFTQGFGAATGKAQEFGRSGMAAMELVVRGVGAVIEATKFMLVAFNAVKTAASGIGLVWDATMATAANKTAELLKVKSEFDKQAYEDAVAAGAAEDLIATKKDRYRQSLEATAKAFQQASQAQDALIKSQENNEKSVDDLFASYASFEKDLKLDDFLDKVNKKFEENSKATDDNNQSHERLNSGLKNFADFSDKAGASTGKLTEAQKQAKKSNEDFAQALEQVRSEYDRTYEAEQKRDKAIRILQAAVIQGKISGDEYKRMLIDVQNAYDQATAKGSKYQGVVEDLKDKFIDGYKAMKDRNDQMDQANQLMEEGRITTEEYSQILAGISKEYENATKKTEEHGEKVDQLGEIYKNAASGIQNAFTDMFYNLFDKGLSSFKDLGKSLLDTFKHVLAQMATMAIAQPIIVPMVQSLGGMMGLGQGQIGNLITSMFGQGAGAATSAGGGGIMNMLGGLFGKGKSLPNVGPWAAATGGQVGPWAASDPLGLVPNYGVGAPMTYAGGTGAYTPLGGSIGGFSTLGLGGGLLGLKYGLGRGDGGLGTAASGAAGAFGGYALGAAGAAGAGALMGGAGLMGAGSAALGAIGPLGWLALGGLGLDKLTGGSLFGTKYKTTSETASFGLSSSGGTASNITKQSKKKAFFGGTKTKTSTSAGTDDQVNVINQLFEEVKQTMLAGAQMLGTDVLPVIDASWKTITEYDKKGKVKSTKEVSEYMGVVYNEGFEDFKKRVNAEGLIKQLSTLAPEANTIANQFRNSAEKLLDVSKTMVAAQADINSGQGVLGTLTHVVDLVQKFGKSGETMLDTYARLQTSTKGLTDILDILGTSINKSGDDFIKFASDLADAAGGLEGVDKLFGSFRENYFTPQERKAQEVDYLKKDVTKQVGDLGDAGAGLTYETFRKRFEEALPNLTAEQVKEWLEAGDALAKLHTAIGDVNATVIDTNKGLDAYNNVFKDFNSLQAEARKTLTDTLTDNTNQILDFTAAYDGSTESQMRLTSMLQDRYEMELQYLSMIDDIQKGLNDNINKSIEDIKLSQMNEEEKYNYFKQHAEELAASLSSMTDPQKIDDTVKQITDLEGKAWGLLTDEQKSHMSDQFIQFLEDVQDIANQRLSDAKTTVGDQHDTIAQAVNDALQKAADAQVAAANAQTTAAVQQTQAADKQVEAAEKNSNIVIKVEIDDKKTDVGGYYQP